MTRQTETSTIALAGLSPDGLSLSNLLAGNCALRVFDRDQAVLDEFGAMLGRHAICTADPAAAFTTAQHVFVTAPTVFDPETKGMDGTAVAEMIDLVRLHNDQATIVIVAPVSSGFTAKLIEKRGDKKIMVATMVAPTPLGGLTMKRNLAVPSMFKLVLGCDGSVSASLRALFKKALKDPDVCWVTTSTRDAEAIRELAFKQRIMHEFYLFDMENKFFLTARDISEVLGDGNDVQEAFYGHELTYGLSDVHGVIDQYLGKTIYDSELPQGSWIKALFMANEVRLKAAVADTLGDYAEIGGISQAA